jgi:hypothetical protein
MPQQFRKRDERRHVGMGIGTTRISVQADRSNIQAGTSSQRCVSDPLGLQRKTASSDFSMAS